MDLVLEVLDTVVFDRFYATLWPLNDGGVFSSTNGTSYSSITESPALINNFHFKPSTQYFQVPPSKWAYLTTWERYNPWRQMLSLYLITLIFGCVLYFVFGALSYYFVFDRSTMKHPRFLKNQISLEMKQALTSMPVMALMTAPCFWLELQGYSKLYDSTADGPGLWYNFLQFPLFIAFTDYFIYWIHRGLHHPLVYKHLHKPHHKWIMPTPFASHAFHPIDGFAQSVPYHLFPFIFPLQKWAYVALFVFINFWTIMIHDGEFITNHPVVNGAACHAIHHMEFTGNFGQFTTFPDRLGGSYRQPHESMFVADGKLKTPLSVTRDLKTE